jgi:hypothetical protein
MISISLDSFEKTCLQRPSGYRDHVLSLGKIVDNRLWLKEEDHTYLANYYRNNLISEPRIQDSAKNLTTAISKWMKAGFPVANEKTISERKESCLNCQFWKKEARIGLGKCIHEKCGCTKLKWWLSTESCPIGKW